MHYAYTEDHREIAGLVREVLGETCDPDVLRAAWDGQVPTGLTDQLTELGLAGLLVDEDRGGQGLDEVFLSQVGEEVGRACVPLPVNETVVMAAELPDQSEFLREVLADGSLITAAGTDRLAPWVDSAALLAVDGAVHRAAAVDTDPVPSVDRCRPLHRANEVPPSASRLADPARAAARLRLCGAAELVGLSRAMVAMTTGYVTEREQFGVPIGSFQAIKHHLAGALLDLEFASPALAEAAWRLATDGPDDQALLWVAHARLRAGRAATSIARAAIQCHGAMGYTTEYPLHFFVKRAWALTGGAENDAAQRNTILEHLGLGSAGHRPGDRDHDVDANLRNTTQQGERS